MIPGHSLQTQLLRVQIAIAMLFLVGTLVFCWRMILVDQTIERHLDVASRLNALHHVIEAGNESQGAHREDARNRYKEMELVARETAANYRGQIVWIGITWSMILAMPLVLAAWPLWLSRGVISGIHRLGRKVELGRRTGDSRAVVMAHDNEIGHLGDAIDEMFRTLKQREEAVTIAGQLSREQQKLTGIVNIIGGIAHEVANPLSVIVANLEVENRQCEACMFDSGDESPIRVGISRIHALLRDITALSSGDTDSGANVDVDVVDVNSIVSGICRIIFLDDRMRLSQFKAVLDPKLPAIRFSPALLTLVIFSMISDTAVMLHGVSGELLVATAATDDALTLTVTVHCRDGDLLVGEDSLTLISMGRMLVPYGGALSTQWGDRSTRITRLSLSLRDQEEDRCFRG